MFYNKNDLKDYQVSYLKKLSNRLYKLGDFASRVKADRISNFLYTDRQSLYFND